MNKWVVYITLGLSTGLIVANLDYNQRKEAYACDITYGTNNEFGFDHLRDNMVSDVSQMGTTSIELRNCR